MSLANDLLRTLSVEEDDKTLVIDHYSRTIVIPKSITTLGVETDDGVLILDFRMPRYLNTVDLSNFKIRVNYINAHGEDDIYKVTDSRVVGSNVLFSWRVGPTATAYKGDTRFSVELINTDSQSTILNEYNTAIAKLPVLEGLEVDAAVITRYTDILEQWESRLFGISGTEEAKLMTVSEEQQAYIVNKGNEVLATIPEDYETTFKLADKAERTKADAIICSAEGEVIKLEDSSDDPLRGLKLYGKTNQHTTTGAQKLPYPFNQTTRTTNGITYTDNGDGSIRIIGTASANAYFDLYNSPSPEISGPHFLSGAPSNSGCKFYAYSGGAYKEDTGNGVSLSGGVTSVHIVVSPGTFISTTVYPMLSEGSEAKSWEPYSEGLVSPSPDWPQPLRTVGSNGNVDLSFHGHNLYPLYKRGSSLTANGVTVTIDDDGIILVNGTASTNTWVELLCGFQSGTSPKTEKLFPLNPDLDYVLSRTILGGSVTGTFRVTVQALSGHDGTGLGDNNDHVLVKGDGVYRGWLTLSPGTVCNNYKIAIQLEEGTVPTPYIPAVKQALTVSTPNGLPGIPVTSGGNYIDSNGQQWIADEIDFERGVYMQRFKSVVFTGQENWVQDSNYSCTYRVGAGHIAIDGLCTHYPTYFTTEDIGSVSGVYVAYTVNHIITDTRFVNDLDGFTAFLAEEYEAGNPVTVLRRLNEPIEIPLTYDELNVLKGIHSNYPTTMVINDSGANMKLVYNADTKTWIENLIDAKMATYLQTN